MHLFTSKGLRPWIVTIAVSLWLATVCNLVLWKALWALPELHNTKGYVFMVGFGLIIFALIALLTALLSWRYVHKVALTLWLVIAAVCTYFMWTYGVVIDRSMIINAMQTDTKESLELMNVRMLGIVLVLAVLPAWVLWRTRIAYARWMYQTRNNVLFIFGAVLVIAISLVACFQTASSTMRNYPQLRYLITPINALWGTGSVLFASPTRGQAAATPINEGAALGNSYQTMSKPPLLVVVVGETARSDHFSLNGYSRNTNPQLAKEDVISFTNAWSCGTSTAASVPCMFSHLGKADFEDSTVRYQNLLDVLATSGLNVVWLDNQAGCKGLCDRVDTINTSKLTHPEHCATGECRDGIMLAELKTYLSKRASANPGNVDKGLVIVLHQMGSHGPAYYLRTDAAHKLFTPECVNNALNTCERDHVVNAYDNTIVATDAFLAKVLNWLKTDNPQYATGMVYVSDHGESLGENNIYLHGLPYRIAPDAQKRVPWITWLSKDLSTAQNINTACLTAQKDLKISHDNLFHSVLGVLDVRSQHYKAELDIFNTCKK